MQNKYYPPEHAKTNFHCPYCNVYAKQQWSHIYAHGGIINKTEIDGTDKFNGETNIYWDLSKCDHCSKIVVWIDKKLIYPKTIPTLNPNDDLSDEIKNDYLEAARIYYESPRASAALLRLALQKICMLLGEKGDNINDDIGKLVKRGLNPTVQKALDALRITGNNAVHPGEINLSEEPERVLKLFDLINIIAEKMITEPKEIDLLYKNLPEESLRAIEKRDK
jgi:hypothetical protein